MALGPCEDLTYKSGECIHRRRGYGFQQRQGHVSRLVFTFQVYGDQLSDEDRRRELNEEKAGCGY